MSESEVKLIPSTQVGGEYIELLTPLCRTLVGKLDEVGRAIVADFLMGRPYREPSSIRSEIEARKSKENCQGLSVEG